MLCHPNCNTCSDGTKQCKSCAAGKYRYLDTFCEDFCPGPYTANAALMICDYTPDKAPYNKGCAQGTYRSTATGVCTACPYGACETCDVDSGKCLSCYVGWYLTDSDQCSACSYSTVADMQLDNQGKCFERCGKN